ncbi:sensory rhodopsin transducer [Micromonospora sp. FIMYZ51]|uniref:sensory rhodopsin transducer n=1 Tax=Micromonospora sp. FIMYZ51 TaxID=3051832 RepID=UPI00311DB127
MAELGARVWLVPGGRIPFSDTAAERELSGGTAAEPEFTSFDQLCVLNTTDRTAELSLDFYYEDTDPVGPYRLVVDARRIRHVRINDLIDPEAIRLDRPYGCLVRSPVPVVVQFLRQDTRLPDTVALTGLMAYPAD